MRLAGGKGNVKLGWLGWVERKCQVRMARIVGKKNVK